MALIVWRSMYTGILSLGKNPGENPLSFKVYVCCIFGFQGKNWQRMSKVHLSGSQRCILNWPQVIFPNFKHRTSDLTFSLSRSMFIERSVSLFALFYPSFTSIYQNRSVIEIEKLALFQRGSGYNRSTTPPPRAFMLRIRTWFICLKRLLLSQLVWLSNPSFAVVKPCKWCLDLHWIA